MTSAALLLSIVSGGTTISEPKGNLKGLRSEVIKRLKKLFRRRVPAELAISPELADSLCALSFELRRQVGVLLNRRGQVTEVVVGEAKGIELPELGRSRGAAGRLAGVRFVHTHLFGEGLDDEDLLALRLSRLDVVCALCVEDGHCSRVELAHLHPGQLGEDGIERLQVPSVYALQFPVLDVVRELESEFQSVLSDGKQTKEAKGKDRAVLIGVRTREGGSDERSMAELIRLAESADLQVVSHGIQTRANVDPRTVVGKGKLQQLILDSLSLGASMIIVDRALSPAQARAIADMAQVEVLDRNQLILAIFGQRAKSRAGRLQVELAGLKYELPRLHQRAKGLSRITGGIGAQGPGETKLEIHRRRVRARIDRLEKEIDALGRQRQLRRKNRLSQGIPVVSLVGYTNAGKSTLLNRLTKSDVIAEDRLFATLDPTSRRIHLLGGTDIVLTDTVGFIQDLPKELVSAFRATLEELEDADVLLHVLDASDAHHETQADAVNRILDDLGLEDLPRLVVFNKVDCLDEAQRDELGEHDLAISAQKGQGLTQLLETLEELVLVSREQALVARKEKVEPKFKPVCDWEPISEEEV